MRVSVVVPLYNKGSTIKAAIDSVIIQDPSVSEIVVVDDGSTDDSLKVVRNIKTSIPIKIIEQENSGVSVARNVGVDNSECDYVCFLDADDSWKQGVVKEFIQLIECSKGRALYSIRYSELYRGREMLKGASTGFMESEDIGQLYLQAKNLLCSSSVCVYKPVFKIIGGFPEGVVVGEDIYTWLKLARAGGVCSSQKNLVLVNKDADNRSIGALERYIPYHIKKYFEGDVSRTPFLDKYMLKSVFLYMMFLCMGGARNQALKYIKLVCKMRPLWASLFSIILLIPSPVFVVFQRLRDRVR